VPSRSEVSQRAATESRPYRVAAPNGVPVCRPRCMPGAFLVGTGLRARPFLRTPERAVHGRDSGSPLGACLSASAANTRRAATESRPYRVTRYTVGATPEGLPGEAALPHGRRMNLTLVRAEWKSYEEVG